GRLLRHSRLAFTGWARLDRHLGRRGFRTRHLNRPLDPSLERDLEHVFAALGRCQRRHRDVPITAVVIPMRREVVTRRGFALEDALLRVLPQAGLDALHPRDAFVNHSHLEALYVPDGHLSDAGNRLLAWELAVHLHGPGLVTRWQGDKVKED